ncbi:MAG: nucleotidyl transferase AbiEii/AbiGii toxin family protein [Gemmatimonadota bacterium]|uniref:nucleotidyl transferase AbiEii/AbiGii toxin family protein n=1 Tax=Candidatus Palauibacter scopulicola TaxID=3056741 RepID=UPI00238C5D4C|nr:nucleotidyl transferase AbiEii/AbiGii toxin family protein [Candidatus Palauibacter scopulicola]MDE2663875.1 nucleotidyl transferase AbiEii/AbiGii toxin family protein [Candidatus Palauibacter scopulicola]
MGNVRFQNLSAPERREALETATSLGGRPAHLLEKDIWVVQTLSVLFETPSGRDLVFKGGTSLAKAYRAIRRFSEDVDITYDIRRFAPELVAQAGEEALPPTRSQERRWTRTIRSRLAEWTGDEAVPAIRDGLARSGFPARLRADGDRVYVGYEPLFDDYGFVLPEVLVEFGARSTGEPRQERRIECDAAEFLPDVRFPSAQPSVMLAERTFWEKATAIHVFCRRLRQRGTRLSRHWHDLVRLDDAGYAEKALADRALAGSVARHKSLFFRERDTSGGWIDYEAAVSGGLQLCPDGPFREALAADYEQMVRGGMLFDDEEAFEEIINRCADVEERANRC